MRCYPSFPQVEVFILEQGRKEKHVPLENMLKWKQKTSAEAEDSSGLQTWILRNWNFNITKGRIVRIRLFIIQCVTTVSEWHVFFYVDKTTSRFRINQFSTSLELMNFNSFNDLLKCFIVFIKLIKSGRDNIFSLQGLDVIVFINRFQFLLSALCGAYILLLSVCNCQQNYW